jgi:pimeloyl-ACP methyl ester carboxylesterase
MGGAIAQLVARDHPEVARGVILSGTAQHWQDQRTRRSFRTLGVMGLALSIAPRAMYAAGLKRAGIRQSERTVWVQSELIRHSVADITEAGRELGRFDSRPWLGSVTPPVAVVITTRDRLVSPRKQRELASAAHAHVFEAAIDHLEVGLPGRDFTAQLVKAITAIGEPVGVTAE